MKIFKYEIQHSRPVVMPKGAVVLSAGQQADKLFVWAMVDPDAPLEQRSIAAFYTGDDVAGQPHLLYQRFLGTVHTHGGALVHHIFEL